MSMEQFKTRQRASEGVRLPLETPDGKPTEHWLQVRHVWSDEFQEANEIERRELHDWMAGELAGKSLPDDAELPPDMRVELARRAKECRLRTLAALVVAWSFEEALTTESVVAFLADAPQVAAAIDTFAVDNEAFFGKGLDSFATGSEPKSD